MSDAAQPAWLKVCTTCSRYAAAPQTSTMGSALADALEDLTAPLARAGLLALRRVPCLAGCKHPGNIALGAPAKTKIRLNGLAVGDAGALAELAAAYLASVGPCIDSRDWPSGLEEHVAVMVAPQSVRFEDVQNTL